MYVTAEKIVFGGKALARVNGKAVFIPFALPDEQLEISLTVNRRDYSEATIKQILAPSPHRIKPLCPHFAVCGGCNLQMADTAYQHVLRQTMTEELLKRAGVACEQPIVFVSGKDWEYRNRFQFHADKDGTIGMHGFASKLVVPVHDCPVAVPLLRKCITQEKLKSLFPSEQSRTKGRYHVFAQEDVYGPVHPDAEAHIQDTVLHFNVFGFFQSNIAMLEKLMQPVCALPAGLRILDLYAGAGTFSSFLMKTAAEIHLVEHNKKAIRWAEYNLKRLGRQWNSPCRCFFHVRSDSAWLKTEEARLAYDAAVIDPPRQGVPEPVLAYMRQNGIPRIHYVSCNPATFARDAKKLMEYGYRFTECRLFDFYPQTHHCELLGIFLR